MKYILSGLLLIILSGCSLDFVDLTDLCEDVNSKIAYVIDDEEHFQSPEETLELGTGDCEDYAILFMYLAYQEFGVKPDMLST